GARRTYLLGGVVSRGTLDRARAGGQLSGLILISLDAIREAAARTSPHLHVTPVLTSRSLGKRAGARLLLKCESFQKTGSFKPRGALNLVLSLPPERRARGLVTVSA